MVDVQHTLQSLAGFGIIAYNEVIRRLPAFVLTVSLPERLKPCRVWGVRIYGLR